MIDDVRGPYPTLHQHPTLPIPPQNITYVCVYVIFNTKKSIYKILQKIIIIFYNFINLKYLKRRANDLTRALLHISKKLQKEV
jgi:hypothetical protein